MTDEPVEDRSSICPSCGDVFGEWTGTHDEPVHSDEYLSHVQDCKGRFHEWSPDGKGWTTPRELVKEDGSKVSDTNPLKPGEVWRFV